MIKIIYDEKTCVKCLACVSESEFGGVTYERGRIFFNETCAEDWENIISICPVAAIKKQRDVASSEKKLAAEATDKNFLIKTCD